MQVGKAHSRRQLNARKKSRLSPRRQTSSRWSPKIGLVAVAAIVLPILGWQLTTEVVWRHGNRLLAQQEWQAAQGPLQLVARLRPQDARIYAKLSESYYQQAQDQQAQDQQAQFSEAIAAYEQAIALDPQIVINFNPAELYQQYGAWLKQQGEIDAAITAYRQAIAQNPEEGSIYLQLGALLEAQENWSAAQQVYEAALARQLPEQAQLLTQLGVVWKEQGKVRKALKQLWLAVKIDPDYAPAYRHLGETLHQRGRLVQAIAFLRQAITLAPKDAVAHQKLCFALHQHGKYDQAVQACQQAIALDPTLSDTKIFLQEIERQFALKQNPQQATQTETLAIAKQDPDFDLKRSVVKVLVKGPRQLGQGTGWVLKRQNNTAWIVTNRHVTNFGDQPQPQTEYAVEFFSQPRSGQVKLRRTAQLIKSTPVKNWLDLAVLRVDQVPGDIQPLTLADNSLSLKGPIRTIGHPFTKTDWSISEGAVTRIAAQVLHLSTETSQGSSGGPVLNDQDQVIGLVFGVQLSCDRIGLAWAELEFPLSCGVALPIEAVRLQLEQWQIL